MNPKKSGLSPVQLTWLGVTAAAPCVLGVVLNFLRPDLVSVSLNSHFGYVALSVVGGAVIFGAIIQFALFILVNHFFPPSGKRIFAHLSIGAVGLFVFTLPSCTALLFGPIVVAMIGAR